MELLESRSAKLLAAAVVAFLLGLVVDGIGIEEGGYVVLGAMIAGVVAICLWVLEPPRNDPYWLADRSWRAWRKRDYPRAADACRRAAELGVVEAMVDLGTLLIDHLGEPDEGERWYREAIEQGNGSAAYFLGRHLSDRGSSDEARELFELAIERGEPGGFAGLGYLAASEGRLDQARADFDIAMREGHDDCYGALAFLLARMGHEDEAELLLREALARDAPSAATTLAYFLFFAGRADEARELLPRIDADERAPWPPA